VHPEDGRPGEGPRAASTKNDLINERIDGMRNHYFMGALTAALISTAALAEEEEPFRVITEDGYSTRILETTDDDGVKLVNHTKLPIEVWIEGGSMVLPSGDHGGMTCDPGPDLRMEVEFEDRTDLYFAFDAPCGSHIEVIEEGTNWTR
jgi:hypothetical protein